MEPSTPSSMKNSSRLMWTPLKKSRFSTSCRGAGPFPSPRQGVTSDAFTARTMRFPSYRKMEEIVSLALKNNCASISYTYTEPTIFFEYAYDTAKLAQKKGLKNNFVTNGYMTAEALDMIASYLDAANVDLKSFSEEFYKKICGARLKPVLENIAKMHELGIWVEVTTLIIPTLNDAESELRKIARFIHSVSPGIPWHVSAFYPTYQMLDKPRTSPEVVRQAREIGLEEGLRYVYTGNIPGGEGENTVCYHCNNVLIRRWGYQIAEQRVTDGTCPHCGTPIDGVWM
jgi:pyruvate formate lyase activating enzyme